MLKAKFGFRYPVPHDVKKLQVSIDGVTQDLDVTRTLVGTRFNVETQAVDFEASASLLKDLPRDGLVLEFLMSEGAGTTLYDTSRVSPPNNGTIYGACLTEDTLIYTPDGVVAISDIKIGDEVYVYNGGVGIKKVVDKIYSGIKPVYRIRTTNKEIYATANHPFLVAVWNGQEYIKGYNREKKHPFGCRKNIWSLEWLPLEKLKEGMAIVCLHKIPNNSNTEFSEDFMRLVGCYLGDGNIIHRKNRKDEGIFLALPKPEDKKKYSEILTKLGIRHIVKGDGIYIYNTKLAELFKELDLDGDAHTKHIPKWVWKLPDSHKRALIEGILDADGWKIKQTSNSLAFQIELANETLVRQLRALCNYIGLKTSNIYYRKKKARWLVDHMVPETECWGFQIYPNRGKNKQPRVVWDGVKRRLSIILPEEFEFQRITEIEYVGERRVYDISIPEVHNFIAEGIVVHNSWVQLPTGKWVLSFDGIDDYGEIPYSPSLDITDAITIIAWVNPFDVSNRGNIFSYNAWNRTRCRINADNSFWFLISDGTNFQTFSGGYVSLNKWSFVVAVADTTKTPTEVRMYVNDQKVVDTTSTIATLGTWNDIRVIGKGWGNIEFFNGLIGLVAIYSRALTEDEIKEIYETTRVYFGV